MKLLDLESITIKHSKTATNLSGSLKNKIITQ